MDQWRLFSFLDECAGRGRLLRVGLDQEPPQDGASEREAPVDHEGIALVTNAISVRTMLMFNSARSSRFQF
jgi:hypothetical protein